MGDLGDIDVSDIYWKRNMLGTVLISWSTKSTIYCKIFTCASSTNIQKLSPTLSHQHHCTRPLVHVVDRSKSDCDCRLRSTFLSVDLDQIWDFALDNSHNKLYLIWLKFIQREWWHAVRCRTSCTSSTNTISTYINITWQNDIFFDHNKLYHFTDMLILRKGVPV